MGLSLGVEFVTDRKSRRPAGDLALEVCGRCLTNGLAVLHHPGGMHGNVIRLMPPLTIDRETAERGLQIFEEAVQHVERSAKRSSR